jgi:hypothetical protein
MILVYFVILVVSGLLSLGLKALGFRYYWVVGLIIFVTVSVGFTVWLNWKIKSGPYP